ncbi:MAG TPA: GTP 3',8-cyclase MoaA, partial [Chloroflexi bacterium]|nr:GTP 3',8-cyclase MoaA [Chloroflexota bacterium]
DSLKEERFREITRGGRLNDTLAGIDAARRVGLSPLKINMVVVRGLNDDEILDFARLSREGWQVRYIELMPLGPAMEWRGLVVREIREEIERHLGSLEPAKVNLGGGPARYYRLPGAQGTIGFIAPLSECFCEGCNRLRLTADGRLRPCLLSDEEIDMKTPLRQGANLAELREIISQGAHMKPPRHRLAEKVWPQERNMSEIGG